MLCCFLQKCKYYRQSFGILLSNRNDLSNCLYERMPQLLLHYSGIEGNFTCIDCRACPHGRE